VWRILRVKNRPRRGQRAGTGLDQRQRLGGHEAKVKISFSYLVAVKIKDETSAAESATPAAELTKANPPQPAASTTVRLLDGKLKIDIPSDFAREPDDPAHPKTLAKFSRKDGAWGEMLRSTHGLTPEKLDGYLKMRVEEYSKGSIGCQGFPPPMVAERNRGRRWPQIGGLALRSNVKGSEGLSTQSGL